MEDNATRSRLTRMLAAGLPVWTALFALGVLHLQGKLEWNLEKNGCYPNEAPKVYLFLMLGPVSYLVPICGRPWLTVSSLYCPMGIAIFIGVIAWLFLSRFDGSKLLWFFALVWWMIVGVSAPILHAFE